MTPLQRQLEQMAETERYRSALQPFANLALYSDILRKMAACLHRYEQEDFLAAFANARAIMEDSK